MKNKLPLILLTFLLFACSFNASAQISTPSPPPSPTATATATETPTATYTPYITPTLPAVLLNNGDWTKPYVALTFDLCQDPKYPAGFDSAIVEVLQRYDVPATFFMGGDWMRTHPEETKLLAANPKFELGNHSWSHPDLTQLSEAEISQQIEMTEDMLFQLTGRRSRVFRSPFGFNNALTLQVIARHGMYAIQWDVVTGDPDPNFDAAAILGEVQRLTRNGSIIIMHANGRGWHTAEALPLIIEYLQGRGFTLVTVSQVIGLEPVK